MYAFLESKIAIVVGDPETSPWDIPKLETSCILSLWGKELDTRRRYEMYGNNIKTTLHKAAMEFTDQLPIT